MKLADIDINMLYSYADYLKWQLEERVELIKGKIFRMAPAPNTQHQNITGDIFFYLRRFLDDKKCSVFVAPFDVRLPSISKDDKEIYNAFQPAMCVVCNPSKIDEKGCIGAPDLVVEVLSFGNGSRELKQKFEAYEKPVFWNIGLFLLNINMFRFLF